MRLYLGKDVTTGGEPPATDLDALGGAVLADGTYVGSRVTDDHNAMTGETTGLPAGHPTPLGTPPDPSC